jgi:hypothetical protein
VKSETEDYLASAHRHLGYARRNLSPDSAPVAAREAYMAAFHAAQALIFERTGKPAKTHNGTAPIPRSRPKRAGFPCGTSRFPVVGLRAEIERGLFVDRTTHARTSNRCTSGGRSLVRAVETLIGA